jgi:hypothetical protein
MSDMNWRDKADEDLTSEDIAAMAAEGQPVAVRGPLPGNGVLISPADTFVTAVTLRPDVVRPTGRRIGATPTLAAF